MPSSDPCTRPYGWRRGRRVPVAATLFVSALAVASAAGMVHFFTSPGADLFDRVGTAWLTALFVAVLAFPLGDLVWFGRGAEELHHAEESLVLRYTPHELPAVVVACLVGAGLGVGLLVHGVRDDAGVSTAAGVAVVAFFLGLLVPVASGRARRGRLVLTPSTVLLRTWSYTAQIPWRDITVLREVPGDPAVGIVLRAGAAEAITHHVRWGRFDQPVSRKQRASEPAQDPRSPRCEQPGLVAVIALDRFAIDPALLLCVLTTYLEHPQLRHELATTAAVRRASSFVITEPGGRHSVQGRSTSGPYDGQPHP